jgi:hypothetical protein
LLDLPELELLLPRELLPLDELELLDPLETLGLLDLEELLLEPMLGLELVEVDRLLTFGRLVLFELDLDDFLLTFLLVLLDGFETAFCFGDDLSSKLFAFVSLFVELILVDRLFSLFVYGSVLRVSREGLV